MAQACKLLFKFMRTRLPFSAPKQFSSYSTRVRPNRVLPKSTGSKPDSANIELIKDLFAARTRLQTRAIVEFVVIYTGVSVASTLGAMMWLERQAKLRAEAPVSQPRDRL